MSRDLLLNRVGDLFHVTGQERERAANILLQWIVARLRFDQCLRIEGVGIFQLKKEPLPRVDRKISPDENLINKRTLIYAPRRDETSNDAESAFVSFDLDELNINSSDYLDKVFNLNVDKPLIPVQDNPPKQSESEVSGESGEDTIEEKIEELVKNGALLENYSILDNYDLPGDTTDKIEGEDDLLKDELIESMSEGSGDDTQSTNEFDETTEEEINILDPSILNYDPGDEEEEIVLNYDEIDEDEEEEDEDETDIIDPMAFIDQSAPDEEDIDVTDEEEKENKELPDSSTFIDEPDLKEESTPLKPEEDQEEMQDDENLLSDDLNDFAQNNIEANKEDQDLQDINNLNAEKFNIAKEDILDVDPDNDFPDMGDISSQESDKEQNTDDEELFINDNNEITDEIVDKTKSNKSEPTTEVSDSVQKEDELMEELEMPDVIEDKEVDNNQGKDSDIFAQLEDYLSDDNIENAGSEINAVSELKEEEELKPDEELSQPLQPEARQPAKKSSFKKPVVVITIIILIAAGVVSIFYFDILGEDILQDISSLFASQTDVESGTELVETTPPAPVDDRPEDVPKEREVQDSNTGLYRDIPNDRMVSNQIYFDGSRYTVQISSWKSKSIAEKEAKLLRAGNFDAFIFKVYLESKKGTWHRVRIGYFNSKKEAEDFLRKNKF